MTEASSSGHRRGIEKFFLRVEKKKTREEGEKGNGQQKQ
jgi:hypothetical protein